MTGIGMNLTEYNYYELRILMSAVLREQVYGQQTDANFERLKQWEVKIMEAMVEVKMKENIQDN